MKGRKKVPRCYWCGSLEINVAPPNPQDDFCYAQCQCCYAILEVDAPPDHVPSKESKEVKLMRLCDMLCDMVNDPETAVTLRLMVSEYFRIIARDNREKPL